MGEDAGKTKAQLIEELGLVRGRLTELETTLAAHDITTCKRITAELQKLKEKYSTILEKSSDAIIILQDGLLKFANSKAAEITGFPLEDAPGKPFIDYVVPEDRSLMIDRYRRRLAGENIPGKYEMGLLTKNGSTIAVEVNASLVEYEGKAATLCMIRDITERKKVEEALRESGLRYRTLVETADDVVLLTDLDGRHIFRNSAYWTSRGYAVGEEIPLDGFASVHPDDVPLLRAKMDQLLENGSITSEYRVKHRDGSWVYQSSKSRVIYDDLGKPKYLLAIVRDITDLVKLQEQLMAQNRLASIGQLVSGVAHELNNPLTSVIGFSELLLKRELPEDVQADLKIVNTEAKRTALIVNNLLTFARKQPQQKTLLDVNELLERVITLRAHEQTVNNIVLISHLASGLPLILGNDSQLQQAFFNIVINAEQAMLAANNKGTFTITSEQMGDSVKISFADNGPGIDPDNMNKLFTPFFTTKPLGKGTGLGLSICHGIIAEHGGKIYAESELGKGATFIVELPVSQPK